MSIADFANPVTGSKPKTESSKGGKDTVKGGKDNSKGTNDASDGSKDTNNESKVAPFALLSKKQHQLAKKDPCALRKHKNLVTDEHKQTASYFVDTTNILVALKMEVGGMVKQGSILNHDVRQNLLGWVHKKGLDDLIQQSHDIGKVMLVQPKAYTSMTCANCGNCNRKLGLSKIFKCLSCLYMADQDHNAVANMIIKAIR